MGCVLSAHLKYNHGASLMEGKAADCHMLLRMIGEVKVSRDRFRCVFVVFPYFTKVFSESVD